MKNNNSVSEALLHLVKAVEVIENNHTAKTAVSVAAQPKQTITKKDESTFSVPQINKTGKRYVPSKSTQHKIVDLGNDKLYFLEKSHRYILESTGETIPHVTKITGMLDKPNLSKWKVDKALSFVENTDTISKKNISKIVSEARESADQESAVAKNTGRAVHASIEFCVKGNKKFSAVTMNKIALQAYEQFSGAPANDEETVSIKNAVKAFVKWMSENNVTIKDSEKTFVAKNKVAGSWAGTLDLKATLERDGKTYDVVIDVKVSSGVYREHKVQTSTYLMPVISENPSGNHMAVILRLDKKTGDFEEVTIDRKTAENTYNNVFIPLLITHRNLSVL